MRVVATIGYYGPRTYNFDTDSPHEALRKLADVFESYEGTRNPWPDFEHSVRIEFFKD